MKDVIDGLSMLIVVGSIAVIGAGALAVVALFLNAAWEGMRELRRLRIQRD